MADWLEKYSTVKPPRPAPQVNLADVAPSTDPAARNYADAALTHACNTIAAAPEGTRNHTLNAEAYSIGGLVKGGSLDAETALEDLTAAGLACGLDAAEVNRTVPRALNEAEPRAVHLTPRTHHDGGNLAFTPTDTRDTRDTDDDRPLYEQHGITGDTLQNMTFPPLQWTVPGLMPEGYGLIVAPPKAGKSWFVAGVGLAAAAGGKAFGTLPVPARPVLYLALEDGLRRLKGRYAHLLDGQDFPAGMRSIVDVTPKEAWVIMREFAEAHQNERPLIIVDTLQKIAPPKTPGEGAYEHDYRVGGMFKNIAKIIPGGTVLAVHHTNKGLHDDFQDSVSGTQGVAGAADFALVLQRRRKSDNAILAVTGRDVAEDEYAMTTDAGNWSLVGGTLTTAQEAVATLRESERQEETINRKGDSQQRITDFVNSSGVLVTLEDVAAKFPDLQKDTIRKNLNRATRSGLILAPSRGLYAPLSYVSGVS